MARVKFYRNIPEFIGLFTQGCSLIFPSFVFNCRQKFYVHFVQILFRQQTKKLLRVGWYTLLYDFWVVKLRNSNETNVVSSCLTRSLPYLNELARFVNRQFLMNPVSKKPFVIHYCNRLSCHTFYELIHAYALKNIRKNYRQTHLNTLFVSVHYMIHWKHK